MIRKGYAIPDDVYDRMRVAAACGGPRVSPGALTRFVVQAIRRALDNPVPGAGLPRLKLCARCFQVNQEAMNAPKTAVVPRNQYETHNHVLPTGEPKPATELFSHLLADTAVAGMMGDGIDFSCADSDNRDSGSEHSRIDGESHAEGMLAAIGPANAEAEAKIGMESQQEAERAQEIILPGVEVSPGLWVATDIELTMVWGTSTCAVLSCAKEPWHRQMVGYQTKSAPEGAERLVARRGNHMALNLIDVRELGPGGAHYVSPEAVEAGLAFISERLSAGDQVIVHDTKAESMAPAIALLWMWRNGLLPSDAPVPAFVQLYEKFLPAAGVQAYLREQFNGEKAA